MKNRFLSWVIENLICKCICLKMQCFTSSHLMYTIFNVLFEKKLTEMRISLPVFSSPSLWATFMGNFFENLQNFTIMGLIEKQSLDWGILLLYYVLTEFLAILLIFLNLLKWKFWFEGDFRCKYWPKIC